MPDKDPLNWTLGTWMLALSMAMGGGIVNWYAKLKSGHVRVFNFVELIGEISTSGFVGLGVFMFLSSWDQPAGACAAAAGVTGHMATRLLFAVERAIERQLDAYQPGKK